MKTKLIILALLLSAFAQTGNDITLDPATQYGTLRFTESGTELDPIVVDANGANIQCVEITGDWIVFRNGKVHGCTAHGIYINGADNFIVEGNEVWDTARSNNLTNTTCKNPGSGWGSAIKVKVGSVNGVIRNNTVHENCGEGIAVTRGANVLVEGNTVYDNYAANIYVDNSPFVTVRNNTTYATGIYLKDGTKRPVCVALGEEFYSGWGAQRHDIIVTGNSMVDCRTGVSAFESGVSGTMTRVEISNNYMPSGQVRGISIQSVKNSEVVIKDNVIFGSIYLATLNGITLSNNVLASVTLTPAPPTNTPPAVTTFTPPPTVTMTPTASKTATGVPQVTPPSPTASFTPQVPTFTPVKTNTPVPASITPKPVCYPVVVGEQFIGMFCP